MQIPPYLKDISTERRSRMDGRLCADPNAKNLWQIAFNSISTEKDRQLLSKALEFGKKIEYAHEGMTSEIYFMHPMRVASYSILCAECLNIDFGTLGLLHNVLEVSGISSNTLSATFGENISSQIDALTVDRSQQWDLQYKNDYYRLINSNPLSCRVVKIFDKLDNLFMLGVNPDEVVRRKYLAEIRTHILPMAQENLPSVYPYLYSLTQEVDSIGFFDK